MTESRLQGWGEVHLGGVVRPYLGGGDNIYMGGVARPVENLQHLEGVWRVSCCGPPMVRN